MKQTGIIKGKKVIEVNNEGLVAVKGYNFYRYTNAEGKWKKYAHISDGINSLFASFSLSRRLTRAEITKCYHLQDGSELCIARKGVFRREADSAVFEKTFNVTRGSRPMYLCEDVDGSVYFGEYFQNMEKQAVHVYGSHDHGKTW